MNKFMRLITGSLLIVALVACETPPESEKGFRLPDGDSDKGMAVFVALECHSCHRVKDLSLPAPDEVGPVGFQLGGEVTKVKTYGELVTSIINPSHKLAPGFTGVRRDEPSPMKVYNDVMTVQQLVDLVAFLQPRYKVRIPDYSYPQLR